MPPVPAPMVCYGAHQLGRAATTTARPLHLTPPEPLNTHAAKEVTMHLHRLNFITTSRAMLYNAAAARRRGSEQAPEATGTAAHAGWCLGRGATPRRPLGHGLHPHRHTPLLRPCRRDLARARRRPRRLPHPLLQRLRAPPPHPPRQRRRPLPLLAHMTGSVQASRGSTTPALHLPPWDTCRPPGAAPVCVRSRLLLQAESRSTLPKRWAGRAVCSSGAGRTGLPFTFSPCRLPHRPHNSVPEALPGLVRAARD